MDKRIFFGLVGKNKKHIMEDKEYELYLINDTDHPVTLIRKASGGFKTYDENIVIMGAPEDNEVDIVIGPHDYILFCRLNESDFYDGATRYEAFINIDGVIKEYWFSTGRGAGFLGSSIPVINKYGRVIYPYVSDVTEVY